MRPKLIEKFAQRRRQRRGLTLIEAALSLGVAAVVLVGLAQLLTGAAETTKARATADRLEEVTLAAQEYIKANFTTLQTTVPVGGALMVAVARTESGGAVPANSLQATGFLSSSFVDANPYGQRHALLLRRVAGSNDRIEGIVTTVGGLSIEDRQLGRVATFVGADGGFMMETPLPGTEGLVTGVGGGWAATAGDWSASGTAPEAGHVMASVAFNEGALVGDYLYRRDIGIPEANRMRTNLSMGGNQINNVTTITQNDAGAAGSSIALGDDLVTIGPNISVPGYITAGDYVHSDTNITANVDVAAGQDVLATRNVQARDSVKGMRFIDILADGSAATYVNDAGHNVAYQVDPTDTTRLNTLTSRAIDGNTRVFSDEVPPSDLGTLTRLIDRLPNYVSKAGYVATPANPIVPKPVCGPHGVPKITLASIQDSMRFAPTVEPIFNGGVMTGITLTENTFIGRRMAAQDTTSAWVVRVSGTRPVPGVDWIVLALTHCYYAD